LQRRSFLCASAYNQYGRRNNADAGGEIDEGKTGKSEKGD
jgi:hypothetical protein